MNAAPAVSPILPLENEWTQGWRIVLGCALASGTGIVLLFFTFSLFVLPIMAELHVSRGEIGAVQALVVTGALGAPLLGRLTDIIGFKPVFALSTLAMVAIELVLAARADSIAELAVGVALLGFFGVGTTAVTITRPVNAHFRRHRGKALGMVVVGVSITTMLAPPLLQGVLETYGWRGGMVALAGIAVAVGLPSVLILVPGAVRTPPASRAARPDWSFLRERDTWTMFGSHGLTSLATAGFVAQLAPIVQAEGLDERSAALALSIFAAGQFAGRLGGGWLLDRYDPRLVAVGLILIPASGFALLLGFNGVALLTLLGAGLIGLQQGGELDIFAYFTARRFGMARYGTVYGALNGVGWIGNALGIVSVGLLHDRFGNYGYGLAASLVLIALAAALIARIGLPSDDPV